jgi:hypothetical protein
MFSRVGRSGYVLKPELLRKKGVEKDKAALVRSERYILELEVRPFPVVLVLGLGLFRCFPLFLLAHTWLHLQIISAQQLPRPRDHDSSDRADVAPVDPFVEVSLYQPGVVAPIKKRTKVIMLVSPSLLRYPSFVPRLIPSYLAATPSTQSSNRASPFPSPRIRPKACSTSFSSVSKS